VAQHAEVLVVIRWFNHPPGVYGLGDVLVEYQLRLAATLEPLHEHPDLLNTLACYIQQGQDRRKTARQLHLHANTVDYRLRRISTLTKIDTSQPHGMLRIIAARRAESERSPQQSLAIRDLAI
jgi:sugar diacid utilization regulator